MSRTLPLDIAITDPDGIDITVGEEVISVPGDMIAVMNRLDGAILENNEELQNTLVSWLETNEPDKFAKVKTSLYPTLVE